MLKILPPKNESFRRKNSDIFHISAQKHRLWVLVRTALWAVLMSTTIYVLSRHKRNNVCPYKPQFYYIKVGFKGVKIIYACFRDDVLFVFAEN